MTSGGSDLVLIGLKGSGKTSYLAAFWHLVEATELPSALSCKELQPDRIYLNRIRDAWLSLKEVERTSLQAEETVSLHLEDGSSGRPINIVFPDPSGERYRIQWAMRRASVEYVEQVRDCAGVLFFLHPATIARPQWLKAVRRSSDASEGIEADAPVPWSHSLAPTQVQLVELLQFVERLHERRSIRIGVVISAWDLVASDAGPSAWLENNLPLLWQFLLSNSWWAQFRTYGVSALGGDPVRDHARLVAAPRASSRIVVAEDGNHRHHDLSIPMRFVLALDE